jgi:hypothetical protein
MDRQGKIKVAVVSVETLKAVQFEQTTFRATLRITHREK